MTLVDTPDLIWPHPPLQATSVTSVNINTTTGRIAVVFQAPATDTMTGFSFALASVTTGCVLDCRLETVGTDGNPTGTLVATNTNGSVTVADTDDYLWKTATFTASASLTKGALYALVVQYSSGSTPNLNLSAYTTAGGAYYTGIPYILTYAASSWTYQTTPIWFCGLLRFGSNYYNVESFFPAIVGTAPAFNNTSTPNVQGMRFTLPFPAKIKGVYVYVDGDAPYDVNLYDSDGTTKLAAFSITDADYPPTTAGRSMRIIFSSPITLAKNTNYWIGIEPTSSTNIVLNNPVMGDAAWIGASWFLSSTYAQSASAKDPSGTGSWTEDGTILPSIALILSAVDDGISGTANLLRGKL